MPIKNFNPKKKRKASKIVLTDSATSRKFKLFQDSKSDLCNRSANNVPADTRSKANVTVNNNNSTISERKKSVSNIEVPMQCEKIDSTQKNCNKNEKIDSTQKNCNKNEKSDNFSDLSSSKNEFFLVHSGVLSSTFKNYFCMKCKSIGATLKVARRCGQASQFAVTCDSCQEIINKFYTSPQSNAPTFDVNEQVVNAFLEFGAGHAAIEKFCAAMDMHAMSPNTYYDNLNKIIEKSKEFKAEVLAKSRRKVREVYEMLFDLKSGEVIDLLVSFDGTWHKRGHVSLYGIAFVIDVITGLVIDYEILSKYCHQCSSTSSDLGADSPEYEFWYESHKSTCCINYHGSSGSMEVKAADIMWRRSLPQSKFRYKTVLSDGDSKAYCHLIKQNFYDGITIEREQCINHVQKRMSSALREEIKKAKAKKITLGGDKKGALTDNKIKHLSNYYRSCIIRNQNDIENMQKEIMATFAHCSSTDENHDHSLCPKGESSWCFYNKAIALGKKIPSHNNMPVYINATVSTHVKPIFERLSKIELLSGCSKGLTQNSNEGLHSVVWRFCPKTTFVSKNRIEIAAAKAVSCFNLGELRAAELYKKNNLSSNTIKILKSRDQKRKRQSDEKNTDEKKKMRIEKKYEKKVAEK